jgi:hypothetical protein
MFVMFEAAISGLNNILRGHRWVEELAAILSLSALIDFINVPKKFHIFELASTVPLWSWSVIPAGSRLLLSDKHTRRACCLDWYGGGVALIALDGQYGDCCAQQTVYIYVVEASLITIYLPRKTTSIYIFDLSRYLRPSRLAGICPAESS